MAKLTNTLVTTGTIGNREELDNIVSRITPEDTPIRSMIGKTTFSSIHPEWEIDALAAPADNAVAEGDEYSFSALDQPTRIGTYTQILRKAFLVSGTQEAVDNAGNLMKKAEQKVKKGKELLKDVELAIVTNTASTATETGRRFGGLPTWLTSNVSRGATGANGGFSGGVSTVATNGTQRAFTKAIMDAVLQSCYISGANVKSVVVSPYVKQVFSTFMSDSNVAPFRQAVEDKQKNTIIAAADMYQGDFGVVAVVPNRVMAGAATTARNAFFIDPDMLEWGWLKGRAITEDKDVARTGDAEKVVLLGEGALKVRNQAGLGVAADLYGLTSAS
jgi:hypothetical protein